MLRVYIHEVWFSDLTPNSYLCGTPLCRWKALAANAFECIWNLNLKWESIIYDVLLRTE